jgi:hypothetical protein
VAAFKPKATVDTPIDIVIAKTSHIYGAENPDDLLESIDFESVRKRWQQCVDTTWKRSFYYGDTTFITNTPPPTITLDMVEKMMSDMECYAQDRRFRNLRNLIASGARFSICDTLPGDEFHVVLGKDYRAALEEIEKEQLSNG